MDYVCFKNYYDIIAIDLSKQQALDATPKAIQQINFFFGNLHQPEGAIIIFHYQRSKKKKRFFTRNSEYCYFFTWNCKVV